MRIILIHSHLKSISTAAGVVLRAFSSPFFLFFFLPFPETDDRVLHSEECAATEDFISSEGGGAFIILVFPCLYKALQICYMKLIYRNDCIVLI